MGIGLAMIGALVVLVLLGLGLVKAYEILSANKRNKE